MRYLIDGYNVMYAGGLLGKRSGPDNFRRVRTRFLNDLAAALGPVDAHATTVVFDASAAPDDVPAETRHKGISVVFAVDDENADARIELLIARHSTPKALTVVSSDRRIRQAATRRRATAVTADAFWETLDRRKSRTPPPPKGEPDEPAQTPEEAEHWLGVFGGLDAEPTTREALGHDANGLTDAEIAELEREIEREFEP